jgi:hypothetical protein
MAVVLLATTALLHADPFVERPIPLPWPDGHDVAIADFNGDGLFDVASLDAHGPFIFECNPTPGPIDCGDRMLLTVALNEGQGNFAPVGTTPAMCLPWTMAAGDFDADGRADVVIGNRGASDAFGVCSPPSVSFYPGTGDGGFGAPQHLQLADEPLDMAAGDFDGDGVQEVAVVLTAPGGVGLFRVTGGVFTQGPSQSFASANFGSVATGNLDGTGRDVIVAARNDIDCYTLMRLLTTGTSLGQFFTCCFEGGAPVSSVLVADLSSDPELELALGRRSANGSAVTVVRRATTFCSFLTMSIPNAYGGHLAAADLNFDGIPDLATTDGVSQVISLLGDGTGHFRASVPQTTSGSADQVAAGDLDDNGIEDLAVTGVDGQGTLALLNQFPGPGLMLLGMDGDDINWHGVVDALSYDIVRGDLGVLHSTGGDYTAALEACVADDVAWGALAMPDGPPVGRGWWILGRANLPGGPGTYDEWGFSQVGQRDAGINASALACD